MERYAFQEIHIRLHDSCRDRAAPGGLIGFSTRAAATAKVTFTATYGR
jgi:hypothetical protein